jgi:hypothetical protein
MWSPETHLNANSHVDVAPGARESDSPRIGDGSIDMTSGHNDRRATSVPAAGAPDLRLVFGPTPRAEGVLDGGWWPHTRNLAEELPGLLAAVTSRFGPVARISLNVLAWDALPQEIPAGDRVVQLAWFRACDAHTVRLVGTGAWHLDLLVIPPDTAAVTATAAMAGVARRDTITALHSILAGAISPSWTRLYAG